MKHLKFHSYIETRDVPNIHKDSVHNKGLRDENFHIGGMKIDEVIKDQKILDLIFRNFRIYIIEIECNTKMQDNFELHRLHNFEVQMLRENSSTEWNKTDINSSVS